MEIVYLVPGFFGFTQLGTLNYFHRTSEVLTEELTKRGVEARIVEAATGPTSSIRRRAIALLETVRETGGLDASGLHFVGHSTGGLDIRLLLCPDVRLVPDDSENRIGERARTASFISVPHFGTPMASFFTSFNGRNVLKLLTSLATSNPGRIMVWAGARSLVHVARLDDWIGQKGTVLDDLAEGLFRHIRPERGDEVWRFIEEISRDQGAMLQLTPESIDLFNASVTDRSNVAYASMITAAPPPSLNPMRWTGQDPYEHVTTVLFALAHKLAARENRTYPYPSQSSEKAMQVQALLPFPLTQSTNDGIVPTLSQIWGDVARVCVADHLDVVGQFRHPDEEGGTHAGWLHSGAAFNEAAFRGLWGEVAERICKSKEA